MTDVPITVRRAGPEHLDRVEALLAADGLPSGDVRAEPDCFSVALSSGAVVGVGGVEVHGSAGLVRSVVVESAHRGRGYGTALCEALENRARDEGVDALYLLTTTAPGFFRRRGYEAVAREAAPAGIRRTTQFAELCPASATCMRKRLR